LKSIGKALTNLEGLAIREVVGTFTGKQLGPTYSRGSTPIDGIWATSVGLLWQIAGCNQAFSHHPAGSWFQREAGNLKRIFE
jgi:hypothetical protein